MAACDAHLLLPILMLIIIIFFLLSVIFFVLIFILQKKKTVESETNEREEKKPFNLHITIPFYIVSSSKKFSSVKCRRFVDCECVIRNTGYLKMNGRGALKIQISHFYSFFLQIHAE